VFINTSFKKYPTFLGFAIDNPTKVGYTLDCEQEILTTKNPTPERFSFFGGCCGQWFNFLASKLYHYAH